MDGGNTTYFREQERNEDLAKIEATSSETDEPRPKTHLPELRGIVYPATKSDIPTMPEMFSLYFVFLSTGVVLPKDQEDSKAFIESFGAKTLFAKGLPNTEGAATAGAQATRIASMESAQLFQAIESYRLSNARKKITETVEAPEQPINETETEEIEEFFQLDKEVLDEIDQLGLNDHEKTKLKIEIYFLVGAEILRRSEFQEKIASKKIGTNLEKTLREGDIASSFALMRDIVREPELKEVVREVTTNVAHALLRNIAH